MAGLLPERVVAGDMGTQQAVLTFLGIQLERQMVRIQPPLTVGDQGPQRMGQDQLMQRREVGRFEMGWQIHAGSFIRDGVSVRNASRSCPAWQAPSSRI